MNYELLWLFILSLAPGFEGRYVVLIAPLLGLSVWEGFIIACIGVVVLGIILGSLIGLIDYVVRGFLNSRIGFLRRLASLYLSYLERVRSRARRFVERYGVIGLSLFVAVPFPLTGVWTGALAGYVLGFPRGKLVLSLLVGGVLSNTITLILALMGFYVVSH